MVRRVPNPDPNPVAIKLEGPGRAVPLSKLLLISCSDREASEPGCFHPFYDFKNLRLRLM